MTLPRDQRSFQALAERWVAVGPYYAMFPVHFADAVIRGYSSPEDVILDPFAGRGTTVFSAATNSRTGLGVEINKVF
jgi:DNA modification methylase